MEKTSTMYIRSISIAGLIIGLLFKTLHWPGANILVLLCSLLAIATFAVSIAKAHGPWHVQLRQPRMLLGALILAVASTLFKTMHWPGANIMLLLGMGSTAIWFLLSPKRLPTNN